MSKKLRQLIVILVVLAVIGGGTALALLLPQGGGESVSSEGAASQQQSEKILEKDPGDITSVLVENQEGSYTIVPDDTSFIVKGYEGLSVNSSAIATAARMMGTLTALRNFGEADDLAQYGLDKPQATLTAKYKDGSTQKLLVGNLLPGSSGNYYVMLEGSKKVYSASISGGVFVNSLSYIDRVLLNELGTDSTGQQEEADFGSIVLSGSNYPQPITIKTNHSTDIADPLSLFVFVMTEPIHVGVAENFVEQIMPSFTTLTADAAVCAKPTQADLEKYGLAEPKAVASYTMNDKEYKLMVGNTDESGTYLMKDGIDVIFQVKDASAVIWANQSVFSLRSSAISLINIELVAKMTVKTPDGEYVFERSRTIDEERTSSMGKDMYNFTTTYNGTELEKDNFGRYYQTVIGILKESPLEDGTVTATEPTVRVELEYFSSYNKKNTVIELYPASDRRYLYRLDGEDVVLVKSRFVDRMIEATQKVIKGEKVIVN